MNKMLLIYNPVAGDMRIQSALSDLVNFFTGEGFLVTVYPTQASGDARRILADLQEHYDRLVVCGGDGMLHEALNGWMESRQKPLLGYIPAGTVNDFASSHEIPRNILDAAKIAASRTWAPIDVGCFNDEYFSYVAAFGLATSVSYKTNQNRKNRLGSLAYVIEALSSVDFAHWENNCETMRIEWADGTIEGDFLYGMVSNSRYVAGSDLFTRNLFDWSDGLLEGVFIRRPMNITELNQIIGCILRSDFDHPLVIQVQSPWFSFDGTQTAWTLDGEFGGTHDRVLAKACPHALSITLPQTHIQAKLSGIEYGELPAEVLAEQENPVKEEKGSE
ncbi:diacylglycerol/lipid kinase family protein [Allobaculum mucilyticum]|uniref:diacylglycerol/lipid kinase family protein n=1 Tax=Allobaculum mucilyticum TaxID=2834459 RepID=UPI001E4AFAC0|nr:diacylglycerol kinase family protein [Allobaculum mucilyticum]UNT96858.1 diacylglycerol kinase family lipid kinase [Allobaculum mucilyticum]